MRDTNINMADTLQKSNMQNPKTLREKLTAWDAKLNPTAQLTEKQRDSFMELTTQSSNRPIAPELPEDDVPSLAPKTPAGAKANDDHLAAEFAKFKLDKIDNAQQFFLWFSMIESKIEEDEEHPQRSYVSELVGQKEDCDQVIRDVSQVLGHLQELRQRYVHVSTKTNALHEACENLLEEQTQLVNTAEILNSKLAYFNELDRISSKLGSPTLTVTNESFVPMLTRLDECIAYLNSKPQYKESSVFLAKFRQSLSRALDFLKIYVTNILQNATQQVLPKKSVPYLRASGTKDTTDISEDAFTLFYGKFRTNATKVKALTQQLEARLDTSPEYQLVLNDCHQCYFQQRQTLLGPSVGMAVSDLAKKHSRDHCALVRSGCSFMVHICEDEYQLFKQFFSTPTQLLDEMLENLCHSLYDVLRPLIIHVNHLETLAELCSILKVEMIEEHVQTNSTQLSAFETVCCQMLEDVQERLVYRTHIYIRKEILGYAPAEGDLAYPQKLEMMESIAASIEEERRTRSGSISSMTSTQSATSLEVENINSQHVEPTEKFVTVPLCEPIGTGNMPMSPADLHGMWYPTVRRTLVCLSKLYRCIDRNTFQGLSQEALSLCIQSLVAAATRISAKKTSLDAHLFLVKHLLILREQIAPFNVEFSVRETSLDFSKFKDAAYGLVNAKGRLFHVGSNNALLQFLLDGTPQVTETFLDSKKEVDKELKHTCEDFIHYTTERLVGPLRDFISKANVILSMSEEDGAPQLELRDQPFASAERLHEVVAETYRLLKTHKPPIQRSMALYLANRDTEYILFKPIKTNVQQYFQQIHQMLLQNYSTEDQQIVGTPSMEQVNLLLTSVPVKPIALRPADVRPSVDDNAVVQDISLDLSEKDSENDLQLMQSNGVTSQSTRPKFSLVDPPKKNVLPDLPESVEQQSQSDSLDSELDDFGELSDLPAISKRSMMAMRRTSEPVFSTNLVDFTESSSDS